MSEKEPARFDQLRYSDEDRERIFECLRRADRLGPHNGLSPQDLYSWLNQIEDIAAAYIGLCRAIEAAGVWPSISERRKQLARLAEAAKPIVFRKAASELHGSLWFSMALNDDLLGWEHWRDLVLTTSEIDPDVPLQHADAIRAAAARELAALEGKKSKPGPRKYELHVWFGRHLMPIYQQSTGKCATAYHTAHEPGPFVRFVMACLEPIDHEVDKEALNEALYNHLFKPRTSES